MDHNREGFAVGVGVYAQALQRAQGSDSTSGRPVQDSQPSIPSTIAPEPNKSVAGSEEADSSISVLRAVCYSYL